VFYAGWHAVDLMKDRAHDERQPSPEIAATTPAPAPAPANLVGVVHDYDNPIVITGKPILAAAPLAVDDRNAIAIYALDAKSGKPLKIDLNGVVTPAGTNPFVNAGPHPDKLPPQQAVDPGGNKFVIDRAEHCIDVYRSRVRVKQIGIGSIVDPTCVQIDRNLHVYVIDNHRLIKLDPLPTVREWEDSHRGVQTQPNGDSGSASR
jgi:hypothetical protein